ncbi:MAG: hypothetical protein EBR82_81605 [Caulobacteraceae bacterium]|nr:hypothetical protein [Caulobacteraceae bacterium]
MSAILTFIEEAIDVPLMDVKNIAPIIEGYCKYNILDETECKYATIELENYDNLDKGINETIYLFDNENQIYYMGHYLQMIKFKDGIPGIFTEKLNERGYRVDDKFSPCEQIRDFPHRYIFTRPGYNDDDGYVKVWSITRKYSSIEAFRKAYSAELNKFYVLLKNDLLYPMETLEIRYCGYKVYRSEEDDDKIEFTEECLKNILSLF